jgi:prolyl-tRNA synthetase
MFVAYLRTFERMGLKAIPMRADTGPIGGSLSHEFIILANTGESEVFCHKDFLDYEAPPADINFDDRAAVQGVVDRWTARYAATSEMHDAPVFEALPEAERVSARGIEVGQRAWFGPRDASAGRGSVGEVFRRGAGADDGSQAVRSWRADRGEE